MTTYTIDAKGKKLGRVASEAARVLMGKDKSSFARNRISGVEVEIVNASQLEITEKKRSQKSYSWFSGFPGGLRYEDLKDAISKKGYGYILRRAVNGMLPKNKLRSRMIKLLKIKE